MCGTLAEEAVTATQRRYGYTCESCAWKKKLKECKVCKVKKELQCYPEESQACVVKDRKIKISIISAPNALTMKSTRRAWCVERLQKKLSQVNNNDMGIIARLVDGRRS